MATRMVINGQVQRGTPLARLVDALAGGADSVNVHAGDVADVLRLCDGEDSVVASLKDEVSGYPGIVVSLDAQDVSHVVDLLTAPPDLDQAPAHEEQSADLDEKPKRESKKKPKAKTARRKKPAADEGGPDDSPDNHAAGDGDEPPV